MSRVDKVEFDGRELYGIEVKVECRKEASGLSAVAVRCRGEKVLCRVELNSRGNEGEVVSSIDMVRFAEVT